MNEDEKLQTWLNKEIKELEAKNLDGEILKDNFELGYLYALQQVREKL